MGKLHVTLAFVLAMIMNASAREVPTQQTLDNAVAPAADSPSEHKVSDQKNFIYGGIGGFAGVGSYAGIGGFPTLGGIGGFPTLGGIAGIGKFGGIGGGLGGLGGGIGGIGGAGAGVTPLP